MDETCAQLTEELLALARLTRSVAHKTHNDVSTATGAVLAIAETCPGVWTKEIAGRLGVGLSVASRHTAELVQAGLLRREPDPGDRRAARLYLTDTGRQCLSALRTQRADWVAAALADWSEADVSATADLLHRLTDDLHTALARYGVPAATTTIAREGITA
ncbi:MAG TPA: MarR family transcriptional regulator [Mycobacteriales bacterium]